MKKCASKKINFLYGLTGVGNKTNQLVHLFPFEHILVLYLYLNLFNCVLFYLGLLVCT